MKRRFAIAVGILATTFLFGCQSFGQRDGGQMLGVSPEAQALADMMSGHFSSAAQSTLDPENYYDIRLRVAPIWTDRNDGPWLYVEQAAANRLDKPYRQRVYRVSQTGPKTFASAIYELPEPALNYAGAWRDPSRFAALTPTQLSERSGCTVYLTKQPDGTFAGSTRGSDCSSRLAGAAYATSEVTVTADSLQSWDRGFDENHEQVWGATEGPYIFVRVTDDEDAQS